MPGNQDYLAAILGIGQHFVGDFGEFIIGEVDVQLGEVDGEPFYMSSSQFEFWKHTRLALDVVPGRGGMFSLDGPEGLRLSKDYGQYDLTTDQWAKINDLLARGLHPVYWKNFQGVYAVKDHLSPEKSPYLLNLFSLLSPRAYDFSQALKADDRAQARQALDTLLTLFPAEVYWREQLQHLH